MVRRIFDFQLRHRIALLVAVVAFTGFMGAFASRVRPDYSVEHFFPVWSEARKAYDRFKFDFPHEDTHALVIVRAKDVFERSGLERLQQLEQSLASLPHVIEVEGPLSIDDIVDDGGSISVEDLFPAPDLDEADRKRRVEVATTDPLFVWSLASPDASAVTIRLTLDPARAASDEGRQEFYAAADALLDEHQHEGQELVLSGLPVIRAKFAKMVGEDVGRLVPIALVVVLLLLFAAFRSVGAVIAGLFTILAALIWSQGFLGLLGYPITVMTSILPIVVMIISISDTVHIVNDFFAHRRGGVERKVALREALALSAGPCLATEIVVACGFLSLLAVNIVAVFQFGLSAAAAMMLTWLANVTVLPLGLSFVRHHGGASKRAADGRAPWAIRSFGRAVDWIGRQSTGRPLVVVGIAVAILAAAGLTASGARNLSYVFDDLRPSSTFYKELRFAEQTHGGLVPVAIYYETVAEQGSDEEGGNPVLEPAIVESLDRATAMLRSLPEVKQANSVADFLRKGNTILMDAEDLAPNGLPESRQLAAQEVEMIDENGMLKDYLSFDRKTAAALGYSLDAGSVRIAEMFEEIDAWVAAEQARLDADPELPRVRIHATGQLRIFRDVTATLTEGLIASFGGAVIVTFFVFIIVLRSFKLAIIGLIPNVSPMILAVAFMALTGITLRPSTVIAFSIILVIADDDTVQYLARLRTNWAKVRRQRHDNYHRAAALSTLRETGLPMFVTSSAVSLGFLLLTLSGLQGIADLGLLIGVTLFAAIFADLFLAPILVEKLAPKLGEPPDPSDAPTVGEQP